MEILEEERKGYGEKTALRLRYKHQIPRDVTATRCLLQVSPVSPRSDTHARDPCCCCCRHAPKILSQSSGLQPHCAHHAARCDKGRQARTQDVSGGRGSDVFWRMEGSWLNRIPGCYWRSSTPGPCPAPGPGHACMHPLKSSTGKTGVIWDWRLASSCSTAFGSSRPSSATL
ncbi:hypothetical protein HDV57DRAFT_346466 [Trichoderma longibrachiatum]